MGSNLYKLRSHGYVELDGEIWFPNLQFNALMKIKKSTGQLEIIDKFPNYNVLCSWLYSTVYQVGDELVFVPCNSEEVVSYDIKTGKFISTSLDKKWLGKAGPYFVQGYVYNHYIYMFPVCAKCIIRYDVINHAVKYLDNKLASIISDLPEGSICFYQQYEVLETKMYIPFAELNVVGIFDLRDESFEFKSLSIEGGCSTINYIDGYYYLASWKSPAIYCWDIETGAIRKYDEFPEEFVAGDYVFSFACSMKKRLFLFPHYGNMIVSFDTESGEIRKAQSVDNIDKEAANTYFVKKCAENIYVLTADMKWVHLLDHKEELQWKPCFQMDDTYNEKKIADFLFDEDRRNLEGYIVEILASSEDIPQKEEQCNCGKRIFDQMRMS